MGGCASKPKELDTTHPEALPTESTSPKKADGHHDLAEAEKTTTTNQEETNEQAPLVDLSKPNEEEKGETSNVSAEAAPAAAAEAEVVATEKLKEPTVDDQVEVAAKQLAEINILEAVKETKEEGQEIKPKATEEEPAAAEIKPKAKEEVAAEIIKPEAKKEDVQEQPKAAAAPTSEDKTKDAPIPTV